MSKNLAPFDISLCHEVGGNRPCRSAPLFLQEIRECFPQEIDEHLGVFCIKIGRSWFVG